MAPYSEGVYTGCRLLTSLLDTDQASCSDSASLSATLEGGGGDLFSSLTAILVVTCICMAREMSDSLYFVLVEISSWCVPRQQWHVP